MVIGPLGGTGAAWQGSLFIRHLHQGCDDECSECCLAFWAPPPETGRGTTACVARSEARQGDVGVRASAVDRRCVTCRRGPRELFHAEERYQERYQPDVLARNDQGLPEKALVINDLRWLPDQGSNLGPAD